MRRVPLQSSGSNSERATITRYDVGAIFRSDCRFSRKFHRSTTGAVEDARVHPGKNARTQSRGAQSREVGASLFQYLSRSKRVADRANKTLGPPEICPKLSRLIEWLK